MTAEQLEQVRALLVRLHAVPYGGPEFCAIVRELDELVAS